jgi:hypothetical protein
MGLVEIKTLQELIEFLPLLAKVYTDCPAIKVSNGSLSDFIADLTNKFGKNTHYFGIKRDNELFYFIAIEITSKTVAIVWLLYINKIKHIYSKNLLRTLMSDFHGRGIREASLTTPIFTRSYERWLGKFGAKRQYLTYKLEI